MFERGQISLTRRTAKRAYVCVLMGALAFTMTARADQISVQIDNLSTGQGVYMTPEWIGFHNGGFDLFDAGVATTAGGGLERFAEDGDAGQLRADFASTSPDGVDDMVLAPAGFPGAPVFDPGDSGSAVFDLDPTKHRYLSYMSMVILGGTSTAPPGITFDATAADFSAPGYELARITIVPEPSVLVILTSLVAVWATRRRR